MLLRNMQSLLVDSPVAAEGWTNEWIKARNNGLLKKLLEFSRKDIRYEPSHTDGLVLW